MGRYHKPRLLQPANRSWLLCFDLEVCKIESSWVAKGACGRQVKMCIQENVCVSGHSALLQPLPNTLDSTASCTAQVARIAAAPRVLEADWRADASDSSSAATAAPAATRLTTFSDSSAEATDRVLREPDGLRPYPEFARGLIRNSHARRTFYSEKSPPRRHGRHGDDL